MVCWLDNYAAQRDIVIEAYLRLREKDPNHELLSLVGLFEDRSGFRVKVQYMERCFIQGDSSGFDAMRRYASALEAATKGGPYELPLPS